MSPHSRAHPAGVLLLTLAALVGGCQGPSLDEGHLFACEPDGSCVQPGRICAMDGLCRPRGTVSAAPQASSYQDNGSAPPGVIAQAAYAHREPKPAPEDEHADARCALQCAERQTHCASRCGEGTQCRQHCVRSTDACYAQCQRREDARELARLRQDAKNCMDSGGRPRKCSESEEQQLREAMRQAAELLCSNENGELTACPKQLEQIDKSRRLLPEDCRETGCTGGEPG